MERSITIKMLMRKPIQVSADNRAKSDGIIPYESL